MKFETLDNLSRVWVYQSDRPFLSPELETIEKEMAAFTNQWNAHGMELTAAGTVVDNHFIVLGANEDMTNISGCSIDSSIRFIKSLGELLNIDFLNRLKVLTISENGDFEYLTHGQLKEFPNRIMYNTLVDRKGDLENNFKIPVSVYLNSRK